MVTEVVCWFSCFLIYTHEIHGEPLNQEGDEVGKLPGQFSSQFGMAHRI